MNMSLKKFIETPGQNRKEAEESLGLCDKIECRERKTSAFGADCRIIVRVRICTLQMARHKQNADLILSRNERRYEEGCLPEEIRSCRRNSS